MSHRLNVYNQIGDLLDGCKQCPKNKMFHNGNRVSPKTICKNCAAFQEMRQLGDSLIKDGINGNEKHPPKLEMTITEYRHLRESGKLDKEIAEIKLVSKNTMSKWKKVHREELKMGSVMTVDEYESLRTKWKTDTKICLEENISAAHLKEWKKLHAAELADIPMPGRKAGSKKSPNATVAGKISTQLREARAEIVRLKEELAGKKNSASASSKTDAEYKEMKDKLLADISTLTEQLEETKKQLQKIRKIAGENAYSADMERNKNAELKHQVDALMADKEGLTAQLEKTEAEANARKEQVESIAKSNNLFEEHMNELHSDLDKLERLEAETARKDDEIQSLQGEITNLNSAAEDTEEELAKARDEASDVSHQLAYTAQDNDRLTRENKRLLDRLNALEQYVYVTLTPVESA